MSLAGVLPSTRRHPAQHGVTDLAGVSPVTGLLSRMVLAEPNKGWMSKLNSYLVGYNLHPDFTQKIRVFTFVLSAPPAGRNSQSLGIILIAWCWQTNRPNVRKTFP